MCHAALYNEFYRRSPRRTCLRNTFSVSQSVFSSQSGLTQLNLLIVFFPIRSTLRVGWGVEASWLRCDSPSSAATHPKLTTLIHLRQATSVTIQAMLIQDGSHRAGKRSRTPCLSGRLVRAGDRKVRVPYRFVQCGL